ncbi:cation-transporting P-type ATPase [Bradyrhizobium sp. CNPSo 4010]|uniref:Cation-transporting P-type ATPase n=1 Tax=Bradyrhizobium agreste TaxID=2751811 RepID=A0ABS0PK31_9BRAD|nr:HAD-IC family P-type ATPase [Bradyrhizobium agreste]MBH5397558.1 cation-transporting P-type ATPase [Bradyrhizobium agreste]
MSLVAPSNKSAIVPLSSRNARAQIPIAIVPLHTAVAGRVRLKIEGMRGAPAIASLLERGFAGVPGIHDVSANALTGNILIHYEDSVSIDQLVQRISGLLLGEITPAVDDPAELPWHTIETGAIASELDTSCSDGLSNARVSERLAQGLGNSIPLLHQRSELSIFLDQFQSMPVALLAGVAVVSVVTGTLLEAGAIMAVVALNAAIGFTTENQAEQTIRSLGAPASLTARVVREGAEMDVRADLLVPGDLVLLRRGTVVPADGRLVSARALTVSEAALTGESLPVVKSVETVPHTAALADRTNMVHRGTIVTGGSGTFVVVATGARSQLGRIQRLVGATNTPETPMQRHLGELGEQLVWATLAASAAVFGVGWLRGLALLQLVRSSLSVAVAAVPEGLPMVATTTLALGVEEMRRQGILVRRLEALETLASVDVVCFDKTGTLTHGSMSLEAVAIGDRVCGRQENGLVDQSGLVARPEQDRRLRMLLLVGALCSETEVEERDGQTQLSGSATEIALVQAALDHDIDVSELRRRYVRRSIQHRTEAYRFMATTHADEARVLIAVKGSPGEVLARCAFEALPDGTRQILTAARRAQIEAQNAKMAEQALRVLGMAYRELQVPGADLEAGEIQTEELIWSGLVGLADPVRSGLPALMQKLHHAGIQTIMLTGDQSTTARAVAERIGLSSDGRVKIIDTAGLDHVAPLELAAKAREAHAFARISPGQKLQIVRALQEAGSVVAMIGDGINDSPALRAADVGMAMGRNGDAAAREVADIFFANDDLASLPLAIARGRGTYTSIRNAVHYIISSNTSEILLMLAGAAVGFGEMLSPIQLLWINLISDVLPAIGLAMESVDPDVMERGPRAADERIIRSDHLSRLGSEAAVLTASAFGTAAFGAMRHGFNSPEGRTMAFGSLAVGQLLHTLNYRSSRPSKFRPAQLWAESRLVQIISGSVAAQIAAMLVPGVRNALNVAPLGLLDAGVMIAGGVLPSAIAQMRSSGPSSELNRLHFRRPDVEGRSETSCEGARRPDSQWGVTMSLPIPKV